MRRWSTAWIAAGVVALAAIAADAPALSNGFVSYDDGVYVLENPHVRAGLTAGGIAWAATATYAGNWHPLTWVSHMIDWSFFGAGPAGHHATSVAIHALNAALLFLALRSLTGAIVRSALVAALFGVHPLQVESVAWVAERKTLLCTCFWWLAILAYARWVAAPSARRLAAVVLATVAALASKPMAVTLPFTLLLLDFWPLRRHGDLGRRVREKWMLFAASAASCAITLVAQEGGHAVRSLERLPGSARVGNALVSYVTYLFRAFWPAELAVYYPHPGGGLSFRTVVGAAALLGALTALAWWQRGSRPHLAFGWLWFLGTLVPVIGLVQVGSQAMADRYAYVPLVGIFVAVVWEVAALVARLPESAARPALAGACLVVAALTVRSRHQAAIWHDTRRLFEHALAVTKDNAIAHVNLGLEDARAGDFVAAERHYEAALVSRPADPDIYNNLGTALARDGRLAEAIERFRTALSLRPDYGLAHANLAAAYYGSGRPAEAWGEVAAARASGVEPPAELLRALTAAMPEPRR